ncbi:MAG: hypothetical protein AAF961_10715, partial [Planctomycetota bacterium]
MLNVIVGSWNVSRAVPWLLAAMLGALVAIGLPKADAAQDELNEQVQALVRQLDANEASERDNAETRLIELAMPDAAGEEQLLAALPAANDQMPQEVQLRLERIRSRIQSRIAEASASASSLTLDLKQRPFDEALDEIESQTGNRLIDYRENFGQPSEAKMV